MNASEVSEKATRLGGTIPKATQPIDSVERVRLGGSDQWARIRGKDTANPVLLLIQQGPGFPMINEVAYASKLWHLEDEFVVVYWDQRGCGKSYNPDIPQGSMTIDRMVEDTGELIAILTERFAATKIYVTGFSQGGTVAALTAARYPERVRAVVCADMDVDFEEAERVAYDFALDQATRRGNKKALKELRRIGPPPHLDAKTFGTRVKWLSNFGGVHTRKDYNGLFRTAIGQMLASYSISDIAKTLRGIGFVQNRLLPDLAHLNLFKMLPRLEVPVFMLQGRHDFAAPTQIAERYYEAFQAPAGKQLIWFEESAHNPWYEEPGKFRETILMIKRRFERTGA